MKKALYVIVIMILIIAFCVSAFLVARYVLEGKKQADRYEDLANIKNQAQTSVPTQATKPSTATEPSKPGFEVISDPTVEGGILLDYAELHDMNPDLAGWIKIEGTKVDYPVMQTSTNNKDYYLKRDFDKQDSVRGCIYAREECDLEKPSDNITMFGHNMKDGTMFGRLTQYEKSIDYLKAHPFVDFSTLWHQERYVIFAVVDVSLNTSSENFLDYFAHPRFSSDIRRAELASMYAIPMDVKPSDALLTLSTCLDENRLVVIARRQRDGESKASLRETVNMAVRQ